jgi:hypothetical protein
MGIDLVSSDARDPAYVAARRVLIDALEALADHRDAVIVIGAQAVYLRTGAIRTPGVAPFTTDADLALDPKRLAEKPALEEVLRRAGFSLDSSRVGTWSMSVQVERTSFTVEVDLLVPERAITEPGRRDARLKGHAERSARRTAGLEAVLVDHDELRVVSLDSNDSRSVTIRVAGPAALLIAKLHKIAERAAERVGAPQRRNRLNDKDAADIYRLFQATPLDVMTSGFRMAAQASISAEAAAEAKEHLVRLFGRRGALGIEMAARALAGAIPPDTIAAVSQRYVSDLAGRW